MITHDEVQGIGKVDGKRYRFHCLYFVELEERLINQEWLTKTFLTIFSSIIKCSPHDDKEDIVWMPCGNEKYSKIMCKDTGSFLHESQYFADAITSQLGK